MTISSGAWTPSQADEARFRTIFEQSPVSTQIFTPDGTTLAVNRAWEALWGVTLDRIGGYNILEDKQLVTKGIMPFIVRGFSGEPTAIPAVKYEPDETIPNTGAVPFRWVRAWIYPVKNPDGTVREVVLMHEDITDQVCAEEALRESEERFRAVFDGAPVGIALIDGSGRYVAVNRARQEMLGYSERELIGRHYLEITHPDDVEQDQKINADARESGQNHYQLEKRFFRKDGTVRWTRITVSMVRDDAGDPLYSVAIAEDITEHKQIEEERSRLARQKDEFLSAAAHDLRTPLTTIKGRLQLLQQRAQRGTLEPARFLDDLGRIDASATRMIVLINELLDVANIQIGRPLQLDRRPVDLVALVEESVSEYRHATVRHRISVQTRVPQVVGRWDRMRLERVLANLLSNAIKYSPEGGDITLTVDREDEDAVLTVRDQGIGIPSGDLEYIFERFHRAQNSAGKIPGTGIGLSAVRAIVEQHGGTIAAMSNQGEGATFVVRLPIAGIGDAP